MTALTPWLMVLSIGVVAFLVGKLLQRGERERRLQKQKIELAKRAAQQQEDPIFEKLRSSTPTHLGTMGTSGTEKQQGSRSPLSTQGGRVH